VSSLQDALTHPQPGGVLCSQPFQGSAIAATIWTWGDYWRFTTLSAQRLLKRSFRGNVRVEAHGNVLAAIRFLHGLALELRQEELDTVT